LATPPVGRPTPDQLAAIGLFNCQTHSEAINTIGRLMIEGRFARSEPEAGILDALIERMKGMGR
ncbi:MAG: hypothetical protein PHU85_17390, partial [Phycisphaerae bacterium]|nr:hypothetical protein [Phycisphaerae bacterium]